MTNKTLTAGEILSEYVSPYLDAADCGLLSDLNPKSRSGNNGQYWALDCPKCGHKGRAFYRASGRILCNRKGSCPDSTSVWDYLISPTGKGMSNADAFNTLCEAVNVDPKEFSTGKPTAKPASIIFRDVLQGFASQYPGEMTKFANERGFTESELLDFGYGYYPTPELVESALNQAGCNLDEAEKLNFIPKKTTGEYNNCKNMSGRIIGFWKQPDGTFGYWGYILKEYRTEDKHSANSKKYLINNNCSKNAPYSFRNLSRKNPVFCEGMLDSDSLTSMGIPSGCTGFNRITLDQAEYLKTKGLTECTFMTDGDHAGFSGAVNSVINCGKCEILANVVLTPSALDDADNIRRQKLYTVMNELIDNSYSPGTFLANAWAYSKTNDEGDKHNICRLIETEMTFLIDTIKVDFYNQMRLFGYTDIANDRTQLKKQLISELLSSAEITPTLLQSIKDIK